MHHAWAAGAGAVRDRGAVEDDGLGARLEAFELFSFGYADAQEFDAVIERQVDRVFTFTCIQSLGDAHLHFLCGRADDLDPAPFTIFIAGIEIKPADTRRGHVRHAERCFGHFVVGVDGRGIRAEAEHLAGTIAAEAPDGGRDLAVRLRRQAVEITFPLGVGEGATFEVPLANIVPGDFFVGPNGGAIRGLGGGFRGRGFGLLGVGEASGQEAAKEEGA